MLKRQADEARLAQGVVFHAYRDHARLLPQCHVYVPPSLSEGFGLAFVKAMGCGVPVVVTATGGAAEIVEHGVTGWIVPEPDESVLTAVLLRVHALGAQRLSAMDRKARASIERRFLPEAYLSKLHDLYAQVPGSAAHATGKS